MATESTIILYDAASLEGKPLAWNAIVSRARYALDFKGVHYKTIWLEYPDIEPTMRSIGAAPTGIKPDGSPRYTIPVIVDSSRNGPDGGPRVVSDSWAIVEYLDEVYPGPSLLLPEGTKAAQTSFQDYFLKTVLFRIAPILIPALYDFLNEASRPYWRETREASFKGVKLEEICPRGTPKWEEAWANLQKGLTDVAAMIDANEGGGKFVMGSTVTFADFTLVSALDIIFLVVPDEWEGRVKHWGGGRWQRFKDDCAQWRSVH